MKIIICPNQVQQTRNMKKITPREIIKLLRTSDKEKIFKGNIMKQNIYIHRENFRKTAGFLSETGKQESS